MWVGREEMGDLGVKVKTGGDEGSADGEADCGDGSGAVERSCEIRLIGDVGFW
jgi:hypothetical protein